MKVQIVRKPILVLSGFLLLSTLLVGCFGGGIDPKDDPVQPGGGDNAANTDEEAPENANAGLNENAANDEGGNAGGNAGNNLGANNNNNLNQGGDNGGKDGEAINNAADDDFLNGNNANANIGAAANGQANMFGNNPNNNNPNGGLNNNNNNNNLNKNNNNNNLGNANFGLNTGDNEGDGALVNGAGGDILETPPDIDKGAVDNTVTNTAEDSTLAPIAGSPTEPTAPVGTPGNGVVRYVTSGGSKLYDKPNGATLRSLEQGDHPLVNEEGEWSRTSDGYYVPAASLTAAPVARAKQPKDWR